MIFKYNYEIGLDNMKENGQVSNKALLHFLENIASKHSDSINNGVTEITSDGVTWVLLEWRLNVIERPKYGDILEVHTWVSNNVKIFSYRDFEIYVNGKLMATASSMWLLVDKDTLKPKRIEEKMMSKYEPELGKEVFADGIPKLFKKDEYNKSIDFAIRKSDIDINKHVHNLSYLDMAQEISDNDLECDNVIISYKKEIKYGDNIRVDYVESDGKYCYEIVNADDNTIHALVEEF